MTGIGGEISVNSFFDSFLIANFFLRPIQCKLPFPSEGLVYDYRLDDGGASNLEKDDDDDDDYGRSGTKKKEVTTDITVS